MRKYYSLIAAALLLGCTDDGSKTTAPRLDGAVVGASGARNGHGNDHGISATTTDQTGEQLAVTLLRGDEEVPPRPTHASGQLILRLSADGQSIDYHLEAANITNVTQAHIHNAVRGVNGGIVVWLYPSAKATTALPGGSGPVSLLAVEGTFTAADFRGPLAGKTMAEFIALIQEGATYGNVHTDDGVAPPNTGPGDFPGGEIRGQLEGTTTTPPPPSPHH